MKIALLHLDLGAGPTILNTEKLLANITLAAQQGAQWIVTPEMALQGYFMSRKSSWLPLTSNTNPDFSPFQQLARRYQVTIFLSCAEYDAADDCSYNSCIVISPNGEISGRHRKMHTVNGESEKWSTPGKSFRTFTCDEIELAVLVCADAWFVDTALSVKDSSAQLIILPAAWPPGCGGPPVSAWKRCCRRSGNLPVIVCNQTGVAYGMNCTTAKSAVIINGKLHTSYAGAKEKILLFNMNIKGRSSSCTSFKLLDPAPYKQGDL